MKHCNKQLKVRSQYPDLTVYSLVICHHFSQMPKVHQEIGGFNNRNLGVKSVPINSVRYLTTVTHKNKVTWTSITQKSAQEQSSYHFTPVRTVVSSTCSEATSQTALLP